MANAYGNYADVLDPVKIVTQVVGVVRTEEYLRNYCILSCGDSTLGTGEIKMVTSATYQDILAVKTGADSDLEKAIKGYFATQGQFVFVLEVGKTASIKTQVDVLESYVNLHPKKIYMFRTPQSWYYPNQSYNVTDSEKVALRVSPTNITLTGGSAIALDTSTNGTLAYDFDEGYDTYFTWDELSQTITAKSVGTDGDPVVTDKPYTMRVTASLASGSTTTASIKLQIADTQVVDGTFSENYSLSRDLAFTNLAAQQPNVKFIISGISQNPDTDKGWELYKGKENVMVVYDNSDQDANGFPLDTAIMGIMGSTYYDISTTNGLTPLNNKSLAGLAYKDLGYTIGEQLIQAPQNIMGDFASNTVVFNGLYADGRSFEFRYAIDLMNYEIDLALKRLLYNSANVSSYTLQYDQNGIDTIDATIRSVLDNLKAMNVVNTYAASYNLITKEMVGEGFINCTEFYTYKAAYPENYAAGIYGGISFYVLIQGFIKEVNLNITIE